MDLGQVFTNRVVANYMVSLLFEVSNDRILDPCFGGGAFLEACKEAGYKNVYGCEIDEKLYKEVVNEYPDYNLLNVDFLNYNPYEVFDGIIMNPPYIRQEKIDDLECLGISKKKLRRNSIYQGLPSTANLYMYFIIKAIDLLKDRGELVVIFPSSWMNARSGQSFNELLVSRTWIEREIHICGEIFEKDALVDVIILKLIKDSTPTEKKGVKPEYLELTDGKLKEVVGHSEEFVLNLSVPFSKYSSVRRGLTTGWNTMFINPQGVRLEAEECITKIISSPKAVHGYSTSSAETDNLLMIPQGQMLTDELQEYITHFAEILSSKKKPKTLYEKSKVSSEWYTLNEVDSNGILFGYFVRNDMKFVMNTSNILARDNFYIIYPRIDKYLMFALLNNYFTYYQLETIGKKYGAGLLKLQRYDIEKLKFVDIENISKEDKEKLVSLAKKLVQFSEEKRIYDITAILSKYTKKKTDEILVAYQNIKKKRLEG